MLQDPNFELGIIVQESQSRPHRNAGMKDVLEANPFLRMQPHEQIQQYRVSTSFLKMTHLGRPMCLKQRSHDRQKPDARW